MKHFIPAMLAVAISLLPLGAVAGEPSAPMPGGPMPQVFFGKINLSQSQQQAWEQIMQQSHQQIEQIHSQAREKILGSLTPEHRTLLAQVVGSLAIAPNPDPDAAVKQLNAALSPGEAQAIVSTHSAAESQMHAIMDSTHQRFQALLTQQQRAQLPNGGEMRHMEKMGSHEQDSAGEILLHMAAFEPEMHMHMEFMTSGHP